MLARVPKVPVNASLKPYNAITMRVDCCACIKNDEHRADNLKHLKQTL